MAKLLLVEDDNNLREIYQARLMAEGYDIVAAQDGEEALVIAKKEKPDLIISDVMMPRISGFEMLDILRNTEGLKNTKVIMLTALGQSEDQSRADSLGADKYLVKSQVTLEDIVKSAQELLGETTTAPDPVPTVPAPDPLDTPVPAPTTPAATPATPTAAPVAATPDPAPAVEPAAVTVPDPAPAVEPAPVTPPEPVATPAAEPAAEPAAPVAEPAPDPTPAPEPVTEPAVEPTAPVATATPDPAPAVEPAAEPVTAPAPDPAPSNEAVITAAATTAATPQSEPTSVIEPSADTSATDISQSLAAEEKAIEEQIENFANQPVDQPTEADPTPEVGSAEASDTAILQNAVEQLNANEGEKPALPPSQYVVPGTPAAEPAPSPTPEPAAATEPVATPPAEPVTAPAPDPAPAVEPAAEPTAPAAAPAADPAPAVEPSNAPASAAGQTPVSENVTVAGKKVIQPINANLDNTPKLEELLAKEAAKAPTEPPKPVIGGGVTPPTQPGGAAPGQDPTIVAL